MCSFFFLIYVPFALVAECVRSLYTSVSILQIYVSFNDKRFKQFSSDFSRNIRTQQLVFQDKPLCLYCNIQKVMDANICELLN